MKKKANEGDVWSLIHGFNQTNDFLVDVGFFTLLIRRSAANTHVSASIWAQHEWRSCDASEHAPHVCRTSSPDSPHSSVSATRLHVAAPTKGGCWVIRNTAGCPAQTHRAAVKRRDSLRCMFELRRHRSDRATFTHIFTRSYFISVPTQHL